MEYNCCTVWAHKHTGSIRSGCFIASSASRTLGSPKALCRRCYFETMKASLTRVGAVVKRVCCWPFMQQVLLYFSSPIEQPCKIITTIIQKQMCRSPREEHILLSLNSLPFKALLCCILHMFGGEKVKVPLTWESDQLARRTSLFQHQWDINRTACFSSLWKKKKKKKKNCTLDFSHFCLPAGNTSWWKTENFGCPCALFERLYLFMHISKRIFV